MPTLLIFDFDERLLLEAEARGYLGGVTVELADGSKYPVFFYDSVRLSQDLQAESEQGREFIAEKGMIVLASITLENMQKSVNYLAATNFFA